MMRRRHLAGLLPAGLAFAAIRPAGAQSDYPNRPIRVIVPYAPGGTDHQIRALAPTFAKLLGQSLVIENREGGGATVGSTQVARAKPDGYTLLYTGTGALTVAPNIRKQAYSIDDFAPIGNVIGTPYIVAAGPAAPFKTLAEMIAWARQAQPDKSNYAASSASFQLATELFNRLTGARFAHVPYKGANQSVQAVMGGEVTMALADSGPAITGLQSGKLRALAVTGQQRIAAMPEVPTFAEAGVKELEDAGWFALFAPGATPAAPRERVAATVGRIVAEPDSQKRLAELGLQPVGSTPERHRAAWEATLKLVESIVSRTGLKLN